MNECTVSFVIATHNRRATLLRSIDRLVAQSAAGLDFEILVVDNASTDGSAQALEAYGSPVTVIRSRRNLGSCAKDLAIDRCRGRFVVFLDDDSVPHAGSISTMIEHFDADPLLAAAGFRVILPDGNEECSALGQVFVGCGVGLRREALQAVGGLDRALFMQAEEYDLVFRLVGAGWRVRRFEDLVVDHLKTPQSRLQARTAYYDTRNNLLLTYRYLPSPLDIEYRRDWKQRYRWLANDAGVGLSFLRGAAVARRAGRRQRSKYRRHRLSGEAVETIFGLQLLADRMASLAKQGVSRVVLAGLGKNIYGYYRAAVEAGISVVAIGDDRFAIPGRRYRQTPILSMADALEQAMDTVVVSDSSPIRAQQILDQAARSSQVPFQYWQEVGGTSLRREMSLMAPLAKTDKPLSPICATASG